jgi:hypothetical protein
MRYEKKGVSEKKYLPFKITRAIYIDYNANLTKIF